MFNISVSIVHELFGGRLINSLKEIIIVGRNNQCSPPKIQMTNENNELQAPLKKNLPKWQLWVMGKSFCQIANFHFKIGGSKGKDIDLISDQL